MTALEEYVLKSQEKSAISFCRHSRSSNELEIISPGGETTKYRGRYFISQARLLTMSSDQMKDNLLRHTSLISDIKNLRCYERPNSTITRYDTFMYRNELPASRMFFSTSASTYRSSSTMSSGRLRLCVTVPVLEHLHEVKKNVQVSLSRIACSS